MFINNSDRVPRGGSYGSDAHNLRSARRYLVTPKNSGWDLGFRLVRALSADLLPSNPLSKACGSHQEIRKLLRQIRAKISKIEKLL